MGNKTSACRSLTEPDKVFFRVYTEHKKSYVVKITAAQARKLAARFIVVADQIDADKTEVR